MPDFLNLAFLDTLPISPEALLVIAAFVTSFGVSTIALLRNRRQMAAADDDTSDMGAIFDNPASILPHVIELAARPLGPAGLETLVAIRVTEPFGVFFRVALTVGAILAAPYIIVQIWIFVAAGLKTGERRWFYLFAPFAVLLFLAGVAFAYFVMLPVSVQFLINFMGFNATPTIENYIKFVTTVLLWVGIAFEMPLIVFALAKLGFVNAGMLARNWRIALVLITVLAAFITPTPDPINMGIVAAPLFVLYLLSIVLALFA